MPLSAKARIEMYLPDQLSLAAQELVLTFNREFSYTFGGATLLRGLDGSYRSHAGPLIRDRVNLLYTDTPFDFENNFDLIAAYMDRLREVVFQALNEEAVLVVAYPVYHAA